MILFPPRPPRVEDVPVDPAAADRGSVGDQIRNVCPLHENEEDRELDFSGVYRLQPDGELSLVYDEFKNFYIRYIPCRGYYIVVIG